MELKKSMLELAHPIFYKIKVNLRINGSQPFKKSNKN